MTDELVTYEDCDNAANVTYVVANRQDTYLDINLKDVTSREFSKIISLNIGDATNNEITLCVDILCDLFQRYVGDNTIVIGAELMNTEKESIGYDRRQLKTAFEKKNIQYIMVHYLIDAEEYVKSRGHTPVFIITVKNIRHFLNSTEFLEKKIPEHIKDLSYIDGLEITFRSINRVAGFATRNPIKLSNDNKDVKKVVIAFFTDLTAIVVFTHFILCKLMLVFLCLHRRVVFPDREWDVLRIKFPASQNKTRKEVVEFGYVNIEDRDIMDYVHGSLLGRYFLWRVCMLFMILIWTALICCIMIFHFHELPIIFMAVHLTYMFFIKRHIVNRFYAPCVSLYDRTEHNWFVNYFVCFIFSIFLFYIFNILIWVKLLFTRVKKTKNYVLYEVYKLERG